MSPSANHLPNSHKFDMKRYQRVIPDNKGPKYEAHWRFDNIQDLVTCFSQPHAQDVFYFHEDIVGIGDVDVKAALLEIDSSETEVWAVLRTPDDFVSTHYCQEAVVALLISCSCLNMRQLGAG